MTDYRTLRFNNLCSPEFRHLLLLLFWPVFGILFALLERGGITSGFHPMYSPIDDMIPFCEFFLPAYMFWFVFLVGGILYTLLCDVPAFRRMMYFIMVTYTITVIIYFIYPTCQNLRPESFSRDNIFTRFMAGFYEFDTNTNVCPSIHVIGSVAVMLAAFDTRRFKTPGWKIAFAVMTALICVSTVFLKQHSIIDVLAAIPVCLVGWYVTYKLTNREKQPVRQ